MEKKVLIVEDDNELAEALVGRLETEGYSTLSCDKVMAGLDRVKNHRILAIVSDRNLKDKSVNDLLEGLQTEFSSPPIVVGYFGNEENEDSELQERYEEILATIHYKPDTKGLLESLAIIKESLA